MKPFIYLLLYIILLPGVTYATHLKGAELTAKRSSSSAFTYIFTLILYVEKDGITEEIATLDVGSSLEATLKLVSEEEIHEQVVKKTYTATHTYPAAGLYQVSYTGSSRNYAVNITDGITTKFYIELQLFINQTLGLNNTPVFKNPPRFFASAGEKFTDDYNATDTEGDSLIYKLVTPSLVTDYVSPAEVGGSTGSTFIIDQNSGHITWDTPKYIGNYVFAVQVEEWRQGVRIGLTHRDIQITVTGTGNGPVPISEERTFNIYPNPANDKVFVNLPETNSQSFAEIWSIKGQMLTQKLLQTSGHADGVIETQHLPAGIYLLKVASVNLYFTRKLIVMH